MAASADEATQDDPVGETTTLHLRLLVAERVAIAQAYKDEQLGDEARRRIEREFDLEEARTLHAAESAGAASSIT